MNFVKPERLQPQKSTIGLIAPSGIVDKKGLQEGREILKSWGFAVRLGKNVFAQNKDFSAGGAKERIADLMEMVEDSKIGAIGCIVGGYAAAEILRYFTPEVCRKIVDNPKIFFGYSDFCLILNVLFSCGLVSLHAPNIGGLYQRSLNTQKSLHLALLGEEPGEIGPWFNWKVIKTGEAEGRLLVSNLEVLVNLLGTVFDPLKKVEEDLILALEEVEVNKSEMSRWLYQLSSHEQVKRIRGIVLGRFTKIGEKDYPAWGKEVGVEQIFEAAFAEKKIPLAMLPEFGHIEEIKTKIPLLAKGHGRERLDFWTLPSGVKVRLAVEKSGSRLVFLEKPVK